MALWEEDTEEEGESDPVERPARDEIDDDDDDDEAEAASAAAAEVGISNEVCLANEGGRRLPLLLWLSGFVVVRSLGDVIIGGEVEAPTRSSSHDGW